MRKDYVTRLRDISNKITFTKVRPGWSDHKKEVKLHKYYKKEEENFKHSITIRHRIFNYRSVMETRDGYSRR